MPGGLTMRPAGITFCPYPKAGTLLIFYGMEDVMKASLKAFAAVGVFLMLSPGNLFADCPSIATQGCCGGFTWKVYDFTTDCPSVTSGVTVRTAVGSCPLGTVHYVSNNASTQTITYQYIIPQTSTGWEIRVDYDFNNGGDTSNFIQASYNVTRSGSSIDSGTFLNTSSTTFCSVASDYPNSWNAGDFLTVTITIRATNSTSYGQVAGLTLFKVPA